MTRDHEKSMDLTFLEHQRLLLKGCEKRERPIAILLGGQPGSGKSGLVSYAMEEFVDKGGVVLIDADKLRVFNPEYRRLTLEDPVHAADRTQKAAGEMVMQLLKATVDNRRNLILDGTMRNPDSVKELAEKLVSEGYEVQARVMAVNPEISLSRARFRFEKQVQTRGFGRFVNRDQHDRAYDGLAESVRVIGQERLVSELRIYDAEQRLIFRNRLIRGQWDQSEMPVNVLVKERQRSLKNKELTRLVDVLGKTIEAVEGRQMALANGIRNGDLDRVRALRQMPMDVKAQKSKLLAVKNAMESAGIKESVREEKATTATEADVSREGEAEAQRLLESAVAQKHEQQAMVEASPLEKSWQESLASYVQLKHDQVARLEDRLEKLLSNKQRDLKRSSEHKPGFFSLPKTKHAWQASQVQQRARIQSLANRLGVVREIRTGMGVFAPRIEEMATRKMRAAHPEMASDWDAMREAFRAKQVNDRLQSKSQKREKQAKQGVKRGNMAKITMDR